MVEEARRYGYEMDDILDEWNYTLLKYNMEDPAPAKQKVCCSFIPSSSLSFNKVSDRRETAKKIQNVKASLGEILKEKDDFKFVVSQPTTEPPRPQSTCLIDVGKVHGVDIDRNKNDIVRKLMDNGGSQIVCVVGMGGLGKTALAQLVYNDTQVKGCFDLTIWICVSDPFDVVGIARGIVESVTKKSIPLPDTNQLEWVLQNLKDSISGKKFFLVLDDVWEEDGEKWEKLKMSLDFGAQGRKILVTTRNERVATMMGTLDKDIYRPQELTNGECWSLLLRISLSGKSEDECEEFEDVGLKIASKCKGLPLAAKVLGSLLQYKSNLEEWRKVLESEIWQLEEAGKKLFPHLLLSYNELTPALKRCFSYCAVYPKDHRINVERLIEEWMAQGGVKDNNGRDYFDNLAGRSLFQDFENGRMSGKIEWCKMHDIVHDFAQTLWNNNQNARTEAPRMTKRSCQVCNPLLLSQAQEFRSLVWGEESPTTICDCVSSVRVLRSGWYWNSIYGLPQGMKKLIHLRWLELSGKRLSKEDLSIICKLYFLQTLLLDRCSIKEIPGEIGNLVELRHLDLSRNNELKELPESICCLVKLQILDTGGCRLLERLPSEIGNLVELRHLHLRENSQLKELPESMCSLLELRILNIEDCWILSRLPEEIHRLKNLQHLLIQYTGQYGNLHFPQGVGELSGLRTLTLGSFIVGSGWNKLRWLKNLNLLTGSLNLEFHIKSIGYLEELVEDAREAELRNKIHIQSLHLHFRVEMEETERSSSLWMDVIEALEPHHKLEILRISGYGSYRGPRLPHWISSPLNLIKEIHLLCLSEASLPPMAKLPSLEVLSIEGLKELKLVGREFLGIECSSSSSSTSNDGVVAFPKLKKLEFHSCNNWKEWSDITAEEEESADVSIMPCLTELHINWCKLLKKLPHRLLHKTSSSLQILNIEYSSELLKSYQDKDGSPWRSISQFNPHLQLKY